MDPGLGFHHKAVGEGLVAVAKSEEAMPLASRPPEARRHSRGDRRRFDHQRARAAHRIENRFQFRSVTARGRPRLPPARDREDARGKHLREWCLDLTHPPAPLMQRSAGRIPEDRGHVAHQVERKAERRPAELHAWPPAAGSSQLIDDRVLDDLRRIKRVRQERVVNRGVDAERLGDFELLGPVDLLHRPVKALGRVHAKPSQRLEDPDRRTALEHCAIERLAFTARLRRELDGPPADPEISGTDSLEFPHQHPLEPLERPCREPRRLVDGRRGQWPGSGRNEGKTRFAHGFKRLYPRQTATAMTPPASAPFRLPSTSPGR